MGRGQVLELVDEQVAVLGLNPAPERAVAQQRLERAVDLLVEVDRAEAGKALPVGVEAGGEPGDVVAHLLDLLGRDEPEPGDRERVEIGTERIGVRAPLAGDREDRSDQVAGLGLVQDPAAGAAVAIEQRVAERVQRPRPRLERRETVSSSFWASLL